MIQRVVMEFTRTNAGWSGLAPRGHLYWWPIVADVFSAPVVSKLKASYMNRVFKDGEFQVVSIDGNMKCCTPLMGQASWRASAAVRAEAAFPDELSKRKVLTMRGRSSCVLAVQPIQEERAVLVAAAFRENFKKHWLHSIEYVVCDDPSQKLQKELVQACPHLKCLCLDPVHLAITYEYATWGKRTEGSRLLRTVMAKFTKHSDSYTPDNWGPIFSDEAPRPLTHSEQLIRAKIQDGSMSQARATAVVASMGPNSPFHSRLQFIELLAAISKLHWADMNRKVQGASKPIKHILWCAAAPDRVEWYFNNIRCRYQLDSTVRGLLPSGTGANESLHAELKDIFRQTQTMHQATQKMKLHAFHMSKLTQRVSAKFNRSVRQCSPAMVLARALSTPIWTAATWRAWCREQMTGGAALKSNSDLMKDHSQLLVPLYYYAV